MMRASMRLVLTFIFANAVISLAVPEWYHYPDSDPLFNYIRQQTHYIIVNRDDKYALVLANAKYGSPVDKTIRQAYRSCVFGGLLQLDLGLEAAYPMLAVWHDKYESRSGRMANVANALQGVSKAKTLETTYTRHAAAMEVGSWCDDALRRGVLQCPGPTDREVPFSTCVDYVKRCQEACAMEGCINDCPTLD
jgi:hypothetical protein